MFDQACFYTKPLANIWDTCFKMVACGLSCSGFCLLLLLLRADYWLRGQLSATFAIVELSDFGFCPLRSCLPAIYIGLLSASQQCAHCVLCPCRPAAVICSLLFISGNVHTNPGPVQFPCGICKRSVSKNHSAVMCDACDLWYRTRRNVRGV